MKLLLNITSQCRKHLEVKNETSVLALLALKSKK